MSAGVLDPTFGADAGYVTTSLSKNNDIANAVLIQPWDGKLVIAGNTATAHGTVMSLARYNADGTLDSAFGSGGEVVSKIGTTWWNAAALYPRAGTADDGKIIEAGAGSLARFNANGSVDTSFGSRGFVAVSWMSIVGVVIQPDGKIVVGGDNGSAFEVSRFNANGSLDTSFGSGGTATLAVGSGLSSNALGLQPDGKLLVAGTTGSSSWELARFNASGTLDTSFDSAGAVPGTVSFSFPACSGLLRALAIYPSTATDTADYGKIVAAGTINGNPGGISSSQIALARYRPDGTPDTTFGPSGQVVTPFPNGGGVGWATTLQADGKIVVAGQTYQYPGSGHWAFSVLRYNTTGSLDTSFGSGGLVVTPNPTGDSRAWAVAVFPATGPDTAHYGKIIAAGSAYGSTGWDFTTARYVPSEPEVGSFTASPTPVTSGSSTTLTASNITDGNPGVSITQVAFYYYDSTGTKQVLGYGTESTPGVWTLTLTVGLAPGTYTLYAQAQDSYGVFGDPLATTLTMQ
jgi:uncharacterized delta-60 repeat protein